MLHFRPHWSFTLIFLPFFAALVALGVWQIERLNWKLGLIAEMNHNLALPPLSLNAAMKLGDVAQYHNVALNGAFDNAKEAYVFTTGPGGAPVYHVVTPFVLDDGRTMLVDRGYVLTTMRDPSTRLSGEIVGKRTIVGVWRTPDASGSFTPKPDLAHRVWYARDLAGIAKTGHVTLASPVIVEADATPNPGGWPKGGQTVVDLPNDHLQYAIIWFTLAFGLLCIFLAFHVSQGRLGLKPAARGLGCISGD